MVNEILDSLELYQHKTQVFVHFDYWTLGEHQFYHRMLGYDPENYQKFFESFCAPFNKIYKAHSYVYLKDLMNFFNRDVFFSKKKMEFQYKVMRVWGNRYIADMDSLEVRFRFIDLSKAISDRKAFCALFFGSSGLNEYLEDEFLNAMLAENVMYIHKMKSYITFSEQLYFLFIKEYSKALWSDLSALEKLKYAKWKLRFGYEVYKVRSHIWYHQHIKSDMRNYLKFECEKGLKVDHKHDKALHQLTKYLKSWEEVEKKDPADFQKLKNVKQKITNSGE